MANWSTLKAAIANVIKTNGNQEITGALLQNTLNSIVNNIGENATFAGVAIPTTNPGAPDGPVFYFAAAAGVYSNFGGISLDGKSLCILITDKQRGWKSQEVLQLDKISPDLPEILRRITGSSTNSSAYTDPFISLGNLDDWQELSSVLNTLYDSKYMGRCRAIVSGMNIEIYQFVENFENNAFSQIVLGNVVPSEDGTQVVIMSASYFDIISRYHRNDVWSEWKSVTKQNIPEATLFTAGLMSAADKRKLIGIPNVIRDLGTFTSAPAAESAAAWADIVTDKKIAFVLYVVNKNGQYYPGIIQNQYAPTRNMQYLLYDGARYSRYIDKDASGNVTAVQSWQRDGARNIDYNANNRTLSLKDMSGSVIGSTATLPEASTSQAGMMSAADKAAVNNIENIETNVETLGGKFLAINYGGTFDVGTTIPVAEFLSKSDARNSVLKPTMYIYYGHNSGNRENAQMIWRQYDDNSGSVTFSFAYFDGAAVVKKVLTLNEAQDAWTVTE